MLYATFKFQLKYIVRIEKPKASIMLDRGRHRPAWQRLAQVLGWLAVVLVLPLAIDRHIHRDPPGTLPVIPLEQFRQQRDPLPAAQVVTLPAGTVIPVEIELKGDIFARPAPAQLPLTLTHPIEVLMQDGKLSGEARIPGESWLRRDTRWISIPFLKAELTRAGPQVRGQLVVTLRPE